jgi:hypothetical protein
MYKELPMRSRREQAYEKFMDYKCRLNLATPHPPSIESLEPTNRQTYLIELQLGMPVVFLSF